MCFLFFLGFGKVDILVVVVVVVRVIVRYCVVVVVMVMGDRVLWGVVWVMMVFVIILVILVVFIILIILVDLRKIESKVIFIRIMYFCLDIFLSLYIFM